MRTNLPFIQHRANVVLNERGPATDVLLTWRAWTGTPTVDPVTGSKTGTSSVQVLNVRALVHFVTASSRVRQFNEVEVGDCIADFPVAAPLDGKEELTFTIGGQLWVQKEISTNLASHWELEAQGQRLWRTVLLRRAT